MKCLAVTIAALATTFGFAVQRLPDSPSRGEPWTLPRPHLQKLAEPRSDADLEAFHTARIEEFISAEGFGVSRLLTLSGCTPEAHIKGVAHEMASHELLSIQGRDVPLAYSGNVPRTGMRHSARAATRDLTSFEAKAVGELLRGETLVARGDARGIEAVGALRAREGCVSCHDVEVGTLLGAFSYRLEPR